MTAIIIPTKNNKKEFFECLKSIRAHTHIDYKVYVADTGSTDEIKRESVELLDKLFTDNYKFVEYDYYNFAKINNDIIRNHLDDSVDILLFCNNDIEIKTDKLIDRMYLCVKDNIDVVGTCGCRLLYPDFSIQHDGQFIRIPNVDDPNLDMGHVAQFQPAGFRVRKSPNKVNGNTFALVATPRELFERVGMLSEDYIECFEDVEYNLRCAIDGRVNVILESDYWAFHHESLSRGRTKEASDRLVEDYKVIYKFVKDNFADLEGKVL